MFVLVVGSTEGIGPCNMENGRELYDDCGNEVMYSVVSLVATPACAGCNPVPAAIRDRPPDDPAPSVCRLSGVEHTGDVYGFVMNTAAVTITRIVQHRHPCIDV